MKRKWWIQWHSCYETMGNFTLYTPWCIVGRTWGDEEPEIQICVAAIFADDEEEIKEIIYASYDKRPPPGSIVFEFIIEQHPNWNPKTDYYVARNRFSWANLMYWKRGEYRHEPIK